MRFAFRVFSVFIALSLLNASPVLAQDVTVAKSVFQKTKLAPEPVPADKTDNTADASDDAPAADAPSKLTNEEMTKYLGLFAQVYQKVRADYVEEVTDQKLVEAALNGMLTSLDPHSSYLNEDDFKDMQTTTKGEFGGLGLEVTMDNGVVKVVSPIDDTPAAKAGLQPGDLVVQIDGKPVMGLTLTEAVQKLRGAPKSKVKLTLVRGKGEPFEKELMRDIIKIQSVRWKAIDNVGYVRITQFNEKTSDALNDALAGLQKQLGKNLQGIVLDLRNNPGGLLDQAIYVSNAFISKGDLVSTRGRHKDDNQVWQAKPEDVKAPSLPMVVLINGGSASASEIVAGALQDHKRAIIMGTKSFGKGSVQTVSPIPGHGALRMTTARYFTPSGHSIQAKGIKPDIEVQQAKLEEDKPKFNLSEHDLKGALSNPDDANATGPDENPIKDVAPSKGMAPEIKENIPAAKDKKSQVQEPFDYQLARAVDLLHGLSIYPKDD